MDYVELSINTIINRLVETLKGRRTLFVGLDIGTSGVKAVLVDETQMILAEANAALTVQRPYPLWSEQDPQAWCDAVEAVMTTLRADHPTQYGAIRGIG